MILLIGPLLFCVLFLLGWANHHKPAGKALRKLPVLNEYTYDDEGNLIP